MSCCSPSPPQTRPAVGRNCRIEEMAINHNLRLLKFKKLEACLYIRELDLNERVKLEINIPELCKRMPEFVDRP